MTVDFAPDSELPVLTAAEEEDLAAALRHAFAPSEIDPERQERLLKAALEDPFAPPTAEELVESERLRRAFDGDGDHLDLALARVLAAAHSPKPPQKSSLASAARKIEPRRTGRRLYLRFGGAAAALAVAAAVLLRFGSEQRPTPAPDLQAFLLAQSRSTAPLFQSAATTGAPSTRIDRIASIRAHELRENRYALWGVR
jgi:hypothetical protein